MEMAYYYDIAEAALLSQDSTRPDIITIDSSAKKKPVPDFRTFINAINGALMKLRIRAPYEEWYSWPTMLLMEKAQAFSDVARETKLDITRKN